MTEKVIMSQQRLSENDLTGHNLDNDTEGEWLHPVLPMRTENMVTHDFTGAPDPTLEQRLESIKMEIETLYDEIFELREELGMSYDDIYDDDDYYYEEEKTWISKIKEFFVKQR